MPDISAHDVSSPGRMPVDCREEKQSPASSCQPPRSGVAATRTCVVLDGLSDPRLAQTLSRAWMAAGIHNQLDPAGQAAWLDIEGNALSESQMDQAASISRACGQELRDRVGQTYQPNNDLVALRAHMAYEYKARFATALSFGLPALVLHYLENFLAGGAVNARSLAFPWLIEMLLVGWLILAAGWPILWQGAVSIRALRMTGDLFTSLLVLGAYLPSAWGVIGMAWGRMPRWGVGWVAAPPVPLEGITSVPGGFSGVLSGVLPGVLPGVFPGGLSGVGGGPAFHIAAVVMMLAVFNRWQSHRVASWIAGLGRWMPRQISLLLNFWLLMSVVVGMTRGWHGGLAFGMLLPGGVGLACANRRNPGLLTLMPIGAFALLVLLGPGLMEWDILFGQVEIAAGFGVLLSGMFAWNWRLSGHPGSQP